MPLSKGKTKQEIRNPRRLLILSPASQSHALIPSLLKQLTGHPPSETQIETRSFAGYTTHPPLVITNKYYTAEVPVWVDEIPVLPKVSESTNEPSSGSEPQSKPESEVSTTPGGNEEDPSTQWAREFSGDEARVVRDAIGAVMICIQNPRPSPTGEDTSKDEDRDEVRALKAFVRAVGTVRGLIEEEREEIGAVPGMLVLGGKKEKKQKPKSKADDLDAGLDEAGLDDSLDRPFSVGWWEDQLCEMGLIGFEVVGWDGTQEDTDERNQYGELQGMRRIKEVLETHEWAGNEDDEDTNADLADDDLERELLGMDEEPSGFKEEVNQLEREMVGLRFAIEQGGDVDEFGEDAGDEELRVDAVEALLNRMRAIKDMSDELPEKDRKRFAAKAVKDIMKEM